MYIDICLEILQNETEMVVWAEEAVAAGLAEDAEWVAAEWVVVAEWAVVEWVEAIKWLVAASSPASEQNTATSKAGIGS